MVKEIYVKIIASILFTLIVQFSNGQRSVDCDSLKLARQIERDTLSNFELLMKDTYYGPSFNTTYDTDFSFGIGYYVFRGGFNYIKFPLPSVETSINYHLSGYLYHGLSLRMPFLITPTFDFITYTDFKNTSCMYRPGIGIDAWIAGVYYSWNKGFNDNTLPFSKHTISLYFRIGIVKNVWKSDGKYDIDVSQWEKRKLRKQNK
jgi:hypothetical protein